MTKNLESNFGSFTIWVNDGSKDQPVDVENYWTFRINHGIGMISRENHRTEKQAGSAAATFMCIHYNDLKFFEFIDSIKFGLN